MLKYTKLIQENTFKEDIKKHHSFGEYIEEIIGDDNNLLKIVSKYLNDIKPDIKFVNALNVLDISIQEEIYKKINDKLNEQLILESEAALSGKNLFKCFLKIFTALKLKDVKPNWEKTPDSFLISFISDSIKIEDVKSVMGRYLHFSNALSKVEAINTECKLYYGIRCDSELEYGIILPNSKKIILGQVKINKWLLNWILTLDSPSALNLKKMIIHMNYQQLLVLTKVKSEMLKFVPGHSDSRARPIIQDDMITFAYYGIGKWEAGKLSDDDLNSIKKKTKDYLIGYKWSSKIKVQFIADRFWFYINIKAI